MAGGLLAERPRPKPDHHLHRRKTDATKTLDSYITVDLAAKYAFTENLDAKFKVLNLLDEDYETSEGWGGFDFVGPERSFYAGIDYRF